MKAKGPLTYARDVIENASHRDVIALLASFTRGQQRQYEELRATRSVRESLAVVFAEAVTP